MGAVTLFGSWLSLCRRTRDRRRADGIADHSERLREPPVVLAEIIATSSFLDFGGIPDARLFYTLYDWRLSQAGGGSDNVRSKRGGRCHSISLPASKKEFSTTVPTKEQTIGDREPEGKPLPKFAE
jgi:hypothetical protein